MSEILREHSFPSERSIQIARGDITNEQVDAIVNAANSQLQHGGGVAAAISRRGGPEIQKESNAWVKEHGPVSNEEPAYTHAGNLPNRYIIHAVGPMWGEGNEDVKLAAAVTGALKLANRLDMKSIALPAISTGIFGFPKERAAGIILDTIREYLLSSECTNLQLVRLTLFDQPTVDAFLKAFEWKIEKD